MTLRYDGGQTGTANIVAHSMGRHAHPVVIAPIDYGPLPTQICYGIRRAYSHLFHGLNEILKDFGLAPGPYSVLLLIELNPGLSQMAVADAAGLDRCAIVQMTGRLVKAGWVRRVLSV